MFSRADKINDKLITKQITRSSLENITRIFLIIDLGLFLIFQIINMSNSFDEFFIDMIEVIYFITNIRFFLQ